VQILSQKIDQLLIDLAWSLWTELGVAGIKRNHQNCLIAPEELILLTVIVAELDPRLRDEALDWCTRYHHFISISRLRALVKALGPSVNEPFSVFAATLNSASKAHWPLFAKVTPMKFIPSGKSKAPRCELPSLLYLRIRSLFGVGARADLITFFLTQEKNDITASDATEIGYNKRSLADLLDGFVESGFFNVFTTRNKQSYRFIKRDQMINLLGLSPEIVPSWNNILEVILPLRACIHRIEKKTEGTKITEIRSALMKIEDKLCKLNLPSPPPIESDFSAYWDNFSEWILRMLQSFAQGNFGKSSKVLSSDEKRDVAKRIKVQFMGLFSNVESLSTHSNDQTKCSLLEHYKSAFRKHLNNYLPKIHTDDQKKLREMVDKLLLADESDFMPTLKNKISTQVDKILEKYF
jgi:hypothetical protein